MRSPHSQPWSGFDGDMDENLDDLLVDVSQGKEGKHRLTLRRMT